MNKSIFFLFLTCGIGFAQDNFNWSDIGGQGVNVVAKQPNPNGTLMAVTIQAPRYTTYRVFPIDAGVLKPAIPTPVPTGLQITADASEGLTNVDQVISRIEYVIKWENDTTLLLKCEADVSFTTDAPNITRVVSYRIDFSDRGNLKATCVGKAVTQENLSECPASSWRRHAAVDHKSSLYLLKASRRLNEYRIGWRPILRYALMEMKSPTTEAVKAHILLS